jgi:hypothetical protein
VGGRSFDNISDFHYVTEAVMTSAARMALVPINMLRYTVDINNIGSVVRPTRLAGPALALSGRLSG